MNRTDKLPNPKVTWEYQNRSEIIGYLLFNIGFLMAICAVLGPICLVFIMAFPSHPYLVSIATGFLVITFLGDYLMNSGS